MTKTKTTRYVVYKGRWIYGYDCDYKEYRVCYNKADAEFLRDYLRVIKGKPALVEKRVTEVLDKDKASKK